MKHSKTTIFLLLINFLICNAQEPAKNLILLNNFSEYITRPYSLERIAETTYGKGKIYNISPNGKYKESFGNKFYVVKTFYKNPNYFIKNSNKNIDIQTHEFYNHLFFESSANGYSYYRNGILFDSETANKYKEKDLGLYRIEDRYEVFSRTGKSYLFDNITNTSIEYPFSLMPYYFFLEQKWVEWNVKNGEYKERVMFFGYASPEGSGILQFNEGKLETVFKVDYETDISFEVAIAIENALLIIKHKDKSGIDIKTYLDENLKKVEPIYSKNKIFNNVVVGTDRGYKLLSSDEKNDLSRYFKTNDNNPEYFRIYESNNQINCEERFLSTENENITRVTTVFNADGTYKWYVNQEKETYSDGLRPFSSEKQKWDNTKLEYYKEPNFTSFISKAELSDVMKWINSEQKLFNAQEDAKYSNLNLKQEFQLNCLGKGKLCSGCSGSGRSKELTYSTRKVENDTQWDPKLQKMVKVKVTTVSDNDITSQCKSCAGTGHCSTNPNGKYSSVISENYSSLCID